MFHMKQSFVYFFLLRVISRKKEYIRADWFISIVNQRIKGARILHDCARLHERTNFDVDCTNFCTNLHNQCAPHCVDN